ncbi:MAG: dockerin type I repeat-containing protein, partial [candidate division Zixibacteria bacterium]|nr:dockerin type I repeat-containing protein [candidate division Zixibacteria bacterium]
YVTGPSVGSGTYEDYATIKYHQYYLTDGVTVVAFSPVDLIVTDPEGDSIGIGFNTIPGATYDTTQDRDSVTIPNRLVGVYMIRVFPEPIVDKATYSLGIRIDGSDMEMLKMNEPCPSPGEADTVSYNAPWYIRGDADGDWKINAVDVVYLINYLYIRGPAPKPLEAGDVNCDGTINAADVVYLINYLFIGGPPPPC